MKTHPVTLEESAIEIGKLRQKFLGMRVKAINGKGETVYGMVDQIDECIAPLPERGWFRAIVVMHGTHYPCDSNSLALYVEPSIPGERWIDDERSM